MIRTKLFISLIVVILAGVFTGGCSTAATPALIQQTVVHTVPVEVTRDIEVTRIVEITREVLVSEIVEIPVTVTPVLPGITPTLQPQALNTTPVVNTTPQVTPQEKYTGFTPIFVHNRTGDKMDVYLAGPDVFNLVLWGGNQQKIWAREGRYDYKVWINGQEAYGGKFNIVSEDKYDLFLDANKAILWVP